MAQLATVKVSAIRGAVKGRVIITARNHHLVVDAPPLIGGRNEAINTVEMFLAPLAACGVMFIEHLAQEMGVQLEEVRAYVEGDFDPRGVQGEEVDPILQTIRFRYEVRGPRQEEAERLTEGFRQRCPLYRTVAKAVAISEELCVEEGAG